METKFNICNFKRENIFAIGERKMRLYVHNSKNYHFLFNIRQNWSIHLSQTSKRKGINRIILHAEPTLDEPQVNPCQPSPCGPYAICQVANDQSSCSCEPGYIGSPPSCRPECISNSECPTQQACINKKCRDPCVGSCGDNALCSVVSHTAICTCANSYSGDPFTQCFPVTCKTIV